MNPDSFKAVLQDHVLKKWFDPDASRGARLETGLFHQNFDTDWQKLPHSGFSIVYQSRLFWIASICQPHFPDLIPKEWIQQSAEAIWSTFWDRDQGGFFWSDSTQEKHLYGISFAIFALAQAGETERAMEAFAWINQHARSEVGYLETLNPADSKLDAIGTPIGLRSMNTAIHLLEAFTELYHRTHDPKVQNVLHEMFNLVSKRYTHLSGGLIYYLDQQLRPSSELHSYGHALETSFLLLEANEIGELNLIDEAKLVSQRMADLAIVEGWDSVSGAMFDEGPFGKPASNRKKIWWVQFEALNAFRVLTHTFGESYRPFFVQQWDWILAHQLDEEHGGVYPTVDEDGRPEKGPKSDGWTEGYHQTRALLLAALDPDL